MTKEQFGVEVHGLMADTSSKFSELGVYKAKILKELDELQNTLDNEDAKAYDNIQYTKDSIEKVIGIINHLWPR